VAPVARLATATVFAGRRDDERSDGAASLALGRELGEPAPDPERLRGLLRNDLTAAAERACPPVREARAAAASVGIALHLSGTGPALFALADDRADAIRLARRLTRAGLPARPYRFAEPYV